MSDGLSNPLTITGQNQRSPKGSWRTRPAIALDSAEVPDKVESDRGRVQTSTSGLSHVYTSTCTGRDKKNSYTNTTYISPACKREKRYEFGIIS